MLILMMAGCAGVDRHSLGKEASGLGTPERARRLLDPLLRQGWSYRVGHEKLHCSSKEKTLHLQGLDNKKPAKRAVCSRNTVTYTYAAVLGTTQVTLMQRLRRPNRIALMPRLIRNLKRLLRQGKVTMDQTSKA
jgi:hypothetical protein